MFRLLSLFSPPPDGLVKHINDDKLAELLSALWQSIEEDESNRLLEIWTKGKLPNLDDEAKRFILRMIKLDPAKQARMSDIIMDPYLNSLRVLYYV
jgi:hypothetical protein